MFPMNVAVNDASAVFGAIFTAALLSSGWTKWPSRDGWLFRSRTEPCAPGGFVAVDLPQAPEAAMQSQANTALIDVGLIAIVSFRLREARRRGPRAILRP